MFAKRKGFTLVELLIVIIVIGILSGGIMLASGAIMDYARATALISDLEKAKAAGMMYLEDRRGDSFADITADWDDSLAQSASFDRYIEDTSKVRTLKFAKVDVPIAGGTGSDTWLLIGKEVENSAVAEKMTGKAGSALYNGTQSQAFTTSDKTAYVRVR